MGKLKPILIGLTCLVAIFARTPNNWSVSLEGKVYDQIKSEMGTPVFECAEYGACAEWIEGYCVFGIYFLPKILIITPGLKGYEKTYYVFPVWSNGIARAIGYILFGSGGDS